MRFNGLHHGKTVRSSVSRAIRRSLRLSVADYAVTPQIREDWPTLTINRRS